MQHGQARMLLGASTGSPLRDSLGRGARTREQSRNRFARRHRTPLLNHHHA
jgi:hypothetical protein